MTLINFDQTNENTVDFMEILKTKLLDFEVDPFQTHQENGYPILHQWRVITKDNSHWFPLILNITERYFSIQHTFMDQIENNLPLQYFIVNQETPNIISALLSKDIYAFSLLPLREIEFTAYINHFFTRENQSRIFKKLEFSKLDLTDKECKILSALLDKKEEGISRSDLMKIGWTNLTVYHKTLDVHLFNLRRKLEDINVEIVFENQSWKLNLEKYAALNNHITSEKTQLADAN